MTFDSNLIECCIKIQPVLFEEKYVKLFDVNFYVRSRELMSIHNFPF